MLFKNKPKPIIILPYWKASTTEDEQLRLWNAQICTVKNYFSGDLDHIEIKYYDTTGIGWNIYAVKGFTKIDITHYESW